MKDVTALTGREAGDVWEGGKKRPRQHLLFKVSKFNEELPIYIDRGKVWKLLSRISSVAPQVVCVSQETAGP